MELLRSIIHAAGNGIAEVGLNYLALMSTPVSRFQLRRAADSVLSGLVRSFGHFNHDEMVAVYFDRPGFSPCADDSLWISF